MAVQSLHILHSTFVLFFACLAGIRTVKIVGVHKVLVYMAIVAVLKSTFVDDLQVSIAVVEQHPVGNEWAGTLTRIRLGRYFTLTAVRRPFFGRAKVPYRVCLVPFHRNPLDRWNVRWD